MELHTESLLEEYDNVAVLHKSDPIERTIRRILLQFPHIRYIWSNGTPKKRYHVPHESVPRGL